MYTNKNTIAGKCWMYSDWLPWTFLLILSWLAKFWQWCYCHRVAILGIANASLGIDMTSWEIIRRRKLEHGGKLMPTSKDERELEQEGVRDWYIDIWQWQFHFHKKRTRTYCKYKSQTCHVIATSFHTPTSLIFPSEFELGSLSWIQDAKGFGFKEPYSLQCKRAMSLFLLTFAFARTIGFASSFFTFITSRVRVNCHLDLTSF